MLRSYTRHFMTVLTVMIMAVFVVMISARLILADGHAGASWTLNSASSKLAFGSIKKDSIGEVHSFEGLSGTVNAQGAVMIEIDLTSVQTNIDIRNERFGTYVFEGAKTASLRATIDIDAMAAMAVGGTQVIDAEAVLSFLGADIEVDAELFVVRLSQTSVMVSTNDMIFIGTEDLGITAGVDKLMELAKLPGITRTTPVTLRLVFTMDEQKAEAPTPAATVSTELAGDVSAGKKVFKKCKACHSLKEGKKGVGPSLYKIVNAPAGAVEGYKYSKSMAESGLVWDAQTLTAFLAKPRKVVKGTKMAFPGLKKEADIANLIAYITSESE